MRVHVCVKLDFVTYSQFRTKSRYNLLLSYNYKLLYLHQKEELFP